MLQNVVALALPGVAPFELGVVCEVFGIDRSDVGLPAFDFAVVSEGGAPVQSSVGLHDRPPARTRAGRSTPTWCASRRPHRPRGEPGDASSCCSRRSRVVDACSASAAVPSRSLLPGCSTTGRAPPTGSTSTSCASSSRSHDVDPRRALRRRRPRHHQRRHGRRHRRLPAPRPQGARRRGRQRNRPPHGGAAAPRGWPGAVHRATRRGVRVRGA